MALPNGGQLAAACLSGHVELNQQNSLSAACISNANFEGDLITINAAACEVGHIVMVTLNTALLLRLI